MTEREIQHEPDDELLSTYLDGELSAEERAAVEARLASDPDAQQLLHQLRSVSQSVQALPLVASPDFRNEILRRIETHTAPAPAADRDDITKALPGGNTNDTIFQSRRPWIWATVALAAGLLIMVTQSNNRDADKLRDLAQNTKSVDADRKLSESRPVPAASAPASSSSVASNTELEQSRIDSSETMPAPATELALEGKLPADKVSSTLPDSPAAPSAPAAAKPSSTAAAVDEFKRADRFSGASAPPAPADGA
jgi:negative regulator of sigma E activity